MNAQQIFTTVQEYEPTKQDLDAQAYFEHFMATYPHKQAIKQEDEKLEVKLSKTPKRKVALNLNLDGIAEAHAHANKIRKALGAE